MIGEWIPALDGTEAKLKAGAKVADVGCGLGTSTILMAQAYPKSSFVGFDYHDGSIKMARERGYEGWRGRSREIRSSEGEGLSGEGI